MTRPHDTLLPPRQRCEDGALRRLGIEIEFAGLELGHAARIVAQTLQGDPEAVSDYEQIVHVDGLGPYTVELDFQWLKARGRDDGADAEGRTVELEQLSEQAVAAVARHVVPLEVVTPPIPMDRLPEVDSLVDALRTAGARGTRDSPVYAFGLHLNPEMPALDAHTVVAYTQSFLCLHDWLVEKERVDLSRRITPYINAFPREYVKRAIAADYEPDLAMLSDDYLAVNADRNRALDLLPLLAHLDEDRVRDAIDDPRIKSRPALHYRLPNCEIDDGNWGVRCAWRRWLEVERLAADDDARAAICAEYLAHLEGGVRTLVERWSEKCAEHVATTAP